MVSKATGLKEPLWARMYTHERGKGPSLAIPTFREIAQRRGQQKTIKWKGWWRGSRGECGVKGAGLLKEQGVVPHNKTLAVKVARGVSNSLWPHGLYSPWNSPGKNTGAGSLSLLQGIFPTQGSNPGLPHCRRILYQLSHKGSHKLWQVAGYPLWPW